jgi:hypothetical protein
VTKLFYIIGVATLLAGFQNCAKTNFSAANDDGSMMRALSGGTGTDNGDATGDLTQDGSVCQPASGKNLIEPGKAHTSCANMHGNNMVDACDTDPSSMLVACILPGPGKSVKLGLMNGSLAGVNGVSSSVCISKGECLGDVAKAFGVSAAYDRGYCNRNPNVQSLSDAQVKQLLGVQ